MTDIVHSGGTRIWITISFYLLTAPGGSKRRVLIFPQSFRIFCLHPPICVWYNLILDILPVRWCQR